jgi:pSer/pThr/pTyr-binding forkhead associated (FHA) protein
VLEIDPPFVRVRDLGSLNGTYVNGEKVGQRDRALSPDGASRVAQPVRELLDGDELQVGNTHFLVEVALSLPEGAEPLPADDAGQPGDAEAGAYLCVPGL